MSNKFYELAYEKGWHEGPLNVPEKLALIHSEVSEALECYREGQMTLGEEGSGILGQPHKPVGFPSELADIVIRCFDLAGAMNIDLEAVIEQKHEFNKTRPHRHGGKRC